MSKMFEYIQNQIRLSVNESVENRVMYCRLYRGSVAIDLSVSFPFSTADTKRIADYLNMSDTFNSGKAAAEVFCRYYKKSIELFQDYKRHIDSIRFSKSDERLIADCDRMIRKLVKDYNIIAAAFDIPAAVDDPGASGEIVPAVTPAVAAPAAVDDPGASGEIVPAVTPAVAAPAAVDDPGASGAKWYFQRIMNALLPDHLQPLVNTMQPFKKRSAAVFDTS